MKAATAASARVVFLVVERTFLRSLREATDAVREEVGPLEVPVHVLSDVQGEDGWAAVERDLRGATAVFAVHVTEQVLADRLTAALQRATPAPGAFVPINSVASLMRLTRIGRLNFGAERGFMARFGSVIRRPNGRRSAESFTGFVSKVSHWLRFAPGWGHDLRTYLLLYTFYLHSSPENLRGLLLLALKECGGWSLAVPAPVEYAPMALYHPDAPRQFEELADYLTWFHARPGAPMTDAPRVGVILFRSFVLNRNTAHYDAVVRAIEARGLVPLPALAFALDNRLVQQRYFSGARAILSLTGFGYVGGMGANDASGAVEALTAQGVPYLDALALTFQRIEQWRDSGVGLNPLQSMMQVAIPELDGAIEPFIFGGITEGQLDFQPLNERIDRLADRLARLVALAGLPNASKRIAITLFNFPPNKGNLGTAAYLDVFASLQRLLERLRDAGYDTEPPASPEVLRQALIGGNSDALGTVANVAARIPTAEYLRQWPYVREVEQAWGPAPGLLNANGSELLVLGRHFGKVFVGLQPTFGYEGDPLRLMASHGLAPHHGFCAYYLYLQSIWRADAVLHFGTHGALEFMPGKQIGLSGECWPDRLIGALPHVYLYSSGNPSEGTIAKRRSYGTLVSYLSPPMQQAGLYKELLALKDLVEVYRRTREAELLPEIRERAEALHLAEDPTRPEQANIAAPLPALAASGGAKPLPPRWERAE